MSTELQVSTKNLIHWFNTLRNLNDTTRTRALDAFWDTQLEAKSWLVNTLNNHANGENNIYIFGGWIGVLANLLLQGSSYKINKIFSIDIDPWCEQTANSINYNYWTSKKFKAVTANMATFKYYWDAQPSIIINTSTEHVDQNTYDLWFNSLPNDSLIIIQGNNFFACDEHVRCSNTLEDFKRMNHVKKTIYEGELSNSQYTRFMCVFKK